MDAVVITISVITQVAMLSSENVNGRIAASVIISFALFFSLFSKLFTYHNSRYHIQKYICHFMKMRKEYKHTVYFTIIIYFIAIYLNASALCVPDTILSYITICYTIFFIAIEPILHDIDIFTKFLPDINKFIDYEIEILIIHPGCKIKSVTFLSNIFSKGYIQTHQDIIKEKLKIPANSELQLHCAKWDLLNGNILHIIGGVTANKYSESSSENSYGTTIVYEKQIQFHGSCLLYMKKCSIFGLHFFDDLTENSDEWSTIKKILDTQIVIGEMV